LNADGRGGCYGVRIAHCRQLRFQIGAAFFHIVFKLAKAFLFTLQSLYNEKFNLVNLIYYSYSEHAADYSWFAFLFVIVNY
jgi:hypothetical protein